MSNSEDTSEPAEDLTAEPPPEVESSGLEMPDGVAEPEPVEAEQAGFADAEPAEAEPSPDMAPVNEAQPVTAEDSAPGAEPAAAVPEPLVDRPRRAARTRRAKHEGDSWWELVKTVFYAVLIAVFVRTILFQPFNIPSASMVNTLLIGDYLFVSKFSYGYSLYSLPWGYWVRRHVDLPGRVFGSEPERGDIVVFKFPPDNKTDYIKRLIGLPGDRIQVSDGVLYINGNAVKRERVDDYVEIDEYGNRRGPVERYRETLPNGVSYFVLDRFVSGYDNTGVFVVPDGHYFMMGDNRDNSNDSRGDVGFVPYENLVGRARFIWFSIDDTARWLEPWTWFSAIRYDRIATVVD